MSWFWFALIPVAFWLHRKWNKKIDREERKSYGLSPNSKEDFIGSWGVTQRFLHYLDFNVDVYNTYNHILVIRNPRGESFTFMEPPKSNTNKDVGFPSKPEKTRLSPTGFSFSLRGERASIVSTAVVP